MMYEYLFRFCAYVMFGFTLEVVFSVVGINRALGYKVTGRVPKKYLEGFISLYMIPIHGFGVLFGVEWIYSLIASWHFSLRFLVWSVMITATEVAGGFIYKKILGFYSWDYYKDSKYKMFKEGYTLWTLVPSWGIAGLILEKYVDLLLYLSPYVNFFFKK